MHTPNTDLQLLRHMIGLIERDRQHNADQDCRIEAIEKTCNTIIQWVQKYQGRLENLEIQLPECQERIENLEEQLPECQERIENLEEQLPDLERIISNQANVIYEQGCMVNIHSNDGSSIADSY